MALHSGLQKNALPVHFLPESHLFYVCVFLFAQPFFSQFTLNAMVV
jgi:hypothetical protein